MRKECKLGKMQFNKKNNFHHFFLLHARQCKFVKKTQQLAVCRIFGFSFHIIVWVWVEIVHETHEAERLWNVANEERSRCAWSFTTTTKCVSQFTWQVFVRIFFDDVFHVQEKDRKKSDCDWRQKELLKWISSAKISGFLSVSSLRVFLPRHTNI